MQVMVFKNVCFHAITQPHFRKCRKFTYFSIWIFFFVYLKKYKNKTMKYVEEKWKRNFFHFCSKLKLKGKYVAAAYVHFFAKRKNNCCCTFNL